METDDPAFKHVMKQAESKGVELIRLQFTDIFGIQKNMSVPIDELPKALEGELMFDGSSIDGFARVEESDMYLHPDPDTFLIFPWHNGNDAIARLICDVKGPDREPFPGDPRTILRKVIADAEKDGLNINIGPEGEFFLLYTDDRGRPTMDIHDEAGYFDLSPVDNGETARRDMVRSLKKIGFQIESSHHEVAPGQHEIDFKYGRALETADNFITFKYIVKNIAKGHGLYATFMPKPLRGENGSAMHCHQSIFRNGENAFYDSNDELGLSSLALQYIAGILEHAPALTAIANPTVNSYRRLQPGFEAPVHISWSVNNRSALIRVPAGREISTRIEYRSPDATCNPYLLFAAMIAAGLDGIRRQLDPADPIEENIFDMSPSRRRSEDIKPLPGNLGEALKALEKDEVIKEALGEHCCNRFLSAKYTEWNDYRAEVTPWELERYLKKY